MAMIKADSEVTLTGNNTTIEALLVQIFGDNVHVNLTINLLCITFPAPETYVDEQGVTHNYAQSNLNTLFSSSAFIGHLATFVHGCTLTINRLQSDGHIVRTVQEIAYQPAPNS